MEAGVERDRHHRPGCPRCSTPCAPRHLPSRRLRPPPRSGGTLGGILPLLAIFYATMLRSWTVAVDDLADHYDPR